MKRYKVQWAFHQRINDPNIYSKEAPAKEEVGYLLGSWLPRHLKSRAEHPELRQASPEFEQSVKYMAAELPRLVGEGKVWEAYELWEDFYLRFESELGYPLWLAFGTVIVEGSPETGLKNRVKLLPPMDNPLEKYGGGHEFVSLNPTLELVNTFIDEIVGVALRKADLKGIQFTEQQVNAAVQETLKEIGEKYIYLHKEDEPKLYSDLRKGILGRLFPPSSIGLGAFQSWLVQYADFGGAWHPGRHTNEKRAKEQAKVYLERLMGILHQHISAEEHARGRTDYVEAGKKMIRHLKRLIDDGRIWAAYLDFKEFQQAWSRGPLPLEMCMGTMRVIPEPEPEACPGSAC